MTATGTVPGERRERGEREDEEEDEEERSRARNGRDKGFFLSFKVKKGKGDDQRQRGE